MKVVFLGGLFPKESESLLFSKTKSCFQAAANTLQWEIVTGIESVINKTVRIVTVPFVGDYPRDYTALFVKDFRFPRHGLLENYSVGFCNLKLINMFSKYFYCRQTLELVIGRNSCSERTFVVVYGLFAYLLVAAVSLKRRHAGLVLCLIVPDLPEMMGGDSSRIFMRIFHYLNGLLLHSALKQVDCFVLLSRHMVDRLPLGSRPWCVVEGIASVRETPVLASKGDAFIVLYSGTLATRYGIVELLDAFNRISDPAFRLWICGAGDGYERVSAAAKGDPRIEYFGQLARDDVLRLQEQATLLVNPRTSAGEYTKYSFPSKIMEYFTSATPCVMHRLPGVPEEYYDYCIVPPSETSEGLRTAILNAKELGWEELRRMGMEAKDFILSRKTSATQCLKIVRMMQCA